MTRLHWVCLLVPATLVVSLTVGCQRPGGILLTPVSTDKRLAETVIHSDGGWPAPDKVAVIDVGGVLVNEEVGGLFGTKENPVAIFTEKLDRAARDDNVKAVVVMINSPGGTVAASAIMNRELTRFASRRKDVHLVAVITDMGASGGYYLACAAPRIYAMPESVTASIGVIFQTFSVTGSMKLLGIEGEAIKSGPMKDMGSPLKKRTDAERELLQTIINEYYEGFLAAVLKGRSAAGLTREKLMPVADGRVVTGRQALDANLVDALLYPDQVIERVKKDADLSRVQVVRYHRPMDYRANIYSRPSVPEPTAGPTINLLNIDAAGLTPAGPRFWYLWTGK